MKTRKNREAAGVLLTLLCVSALIGCEMSVLPRHARPAGAQGAVRVLINGGTRTAAQTGSVQTDARTVVPSESDFSDTIGSYTLTFTNTNGQEVSKTINDSVSEALLDTGTWELVVTGKSEDPPNPIAEPERVSVEVTGSDTIEVSVTVHPVLNPSGAKGTFSWDINPAPDSVSIKLKPLDVGDVPQDEIERQGATGTIADSLAAGYYWVTVTGSLDGKPIVPRQEVAHIYSFIKTVWELNLEDDDVTSQVCLAGTLTGGIEGYIPGAVIKIGKPPASPGRL
jgi:hypothetical protein